MQQHFPLRSSDTGPSSLFWPPEETVPVSKAQGATTAHDGRDQQSNGKANATPSDPYLLRVATSHSPCSYVSLCNMSRLADYRSVHRKKATSLCQSSVPPGLARKGAGMYAMPGFHCVTAASSWPELKQGDHALTNKCPSRMDTTEIKRVTGEGRCRWHLLLVPTDLNCI